MQIANSLDDYAGLLEKYARLHAAYLARGVVEDLDTADKETTFDAHWKKEHYFKVGADGLRVSLNALVSNLREPPRTILDFPSGSGRVTRHFRACFPDAAIVACDLYDGHVDFCRRTFGVEGFLSNEILASVDFGRRFDLIFCGSLLTHLPEPLCRDALRLIGKSLSDRGIAIVTLQGRYSEYVQQKEWKYLPDDLFDIAAGAARKSGFGYVDYDSGAKQAFDRQASYGISLVRPHWIMREMESDWDLRVLGFAERAWDDHQDVLVFGRPAIDAPRYFRPQ